MEGRAGRDVSHDLAAAGVPEDLRAPFWAVMRENVGTRGEIADWWALCRDGAVPLVADGDRDFVAEAFGMLGEPPYDASTWSDWTGRAKEATGRKGKGLFKPLRQAVTGRASGPDMGDLMPLLQRKPTL